MPYYYEFQQSGVEEVLGYRYLPLTTEILIVSPTMRVDSQEETYGRLLNAF